MTPRKNLWRLYRPLLHRFERMEEQVRAAEISNVERLRSECASLVCINALNDWRNFVRAYYLSIFCGTRCDRRSRIEYNIASCAANQAMLYAVRTFKPYYVLPQNGVCHRRDEPAWHDPNVLLQLAGALCFTNLVDIQASFSIGSRAFLDLPVFRNYYAHRNRESARAAQQVAPQYGVSALLLPTEIMYSHAAGRPHSILLDWLHDIATTAELLCW